ncbi:hypothetical protein STTU_p0158 (plasmid) [Streptomyces sp. Tu6071]|nr:hypothetical protein STTU_p0158 [Streptomyces sp. Tu6071]
MVTLGRAPAITALRLAAVLTHAAAVLPDLRADRAEPGEEEDAADAVTALRTALDRVGLRLPSLGAERPAAMGTAMVALGGAASGVAVSLADVLTRTADAAPVLRADAAEPPGAAREFWPLPAVLLRDGHCLRYGGVTRVAAQAPRLPAPRASTAPRLEVRCVDGTTLRMSPRAALDVYLPLAWRLSLQDGPRP